MHRSESPQSDMYQVEKTWKQKLKNGIRSFLAFLFSNVGIICLVVGYTIAGSFVFIYIEGNKGQNKVTDVVRTRNQTAERLWLITCCKTNLFSEEEWRKAIQAELLEYQRYIVDAVQEEGYEGEEITGNRWSFSGAFLYSLTVITTIGYGNVVPRTEIGKLATVFYAIAGLPLFLLYLSNIGSILGKACKWTYYKCFLCTGCEARRRAYLLRKEALETGINLDPQDLLPEQFNPQTVTVPITLCLSLMIGYLYGGAILFAKWEKWGLLDGAYFCFISLSTIGFGDIVPGDLIQEREGIDLKFIFCSMYLLLGMALIAMCFNLMQEEVMHKLRGFGERIRNVLRCCGN